MDMPMTPNTPAWVSKLVQQPTPPPTVRSGDITISPGSCHDYSPGSSTGCLLFVNTPVQKTNQEHESSDDTFSGHAEEELGSTRCLPCPALVQHGELQLERKVQEQTTGSHTGQNHGEKALVLRLKQDQLASQDDEQQFDEDGQPVSDITRWLYSSTTVEQRRKRLNSLLQSWYPCNEVFNSARHPFYDPVEDGPYDSFVKYEIWDGHCPYDDDDYNPSTDPTKSTEIWQPKIGDEGIETEEDLRMVLKARREHNERGEALERCQHRVYRAQRKAGIKFADMDMTRVFWGPKIELGDSDTDSDTESDSTSDSGPYSSSDESKIEEPALIVKEETPSAIATSTAPSTEALQPFVTEKGIRVFGIEEPSMSRTRQRDNLNTQSKKKQAGKCKRKRSAMDYDGTYKDSGSSSSDDDDEPVYKRKRTARASGSGQVRKPKSRAATKRAAVVIDLEDEGEASE
ncbi:hypothetical protein GGS21DRAFT_314174 [Xylaria nigripes]|nr:hypothetical protein GGS21DRAFT_314174 [Xylaria nigripes]